MPLNPYFLYLIHNISNSNNKENNPYLKKFLDLRIAGAVISATDLLNNIIKEFDNDDANNPKTLDYVNSLTGLAASVAPLFVSTCHLLLEIFVRHFLWLGHIHLDQGQLCQVLKYLLG
jgi:hypothetical protein